MHWISLFSIPAVVHAAACQVEQNFGSVDPSLPPFLLSSHKKLQWFEPSTDSFVLLHEGNGAYYSVITDEPSSDLSHLYVISTYRDLQATDSPDIVLKLQMNGKGEQASVVDQFNLVSRNTHSALRTGNKLLVVNTGGGSVDEYSFPALVPGRRHTLFTRRDHLNSLAIADGGFWVLRHGRIQNVKSDMVKVNSAGEVVDRIEGTGYGSHSIMFWKNSIVYMSARPAGLWAVDLKTRQHTLLWTHEEDSNCGADAKFFAKGLSIVGDLAVFGLSRFQPDRAGRMAAKVVLFGVDLVKGQVQWQRQLPENSGLVNEVAVPTISSDSSYVALPHHKEL